MKRINTQPIAILMATYNGEKYLAEQIDSIIAQTCNDWTLYIQDDGSTDNTRAIIAQYVAKDHRIQHIDLGLTRQGACDNFMTLLNVVESDYYLFADQDDVWLPHKIAVSIDKVKALEAEHGDKPICIGTDKAFVDEQLNIISPSVINRKNLPLPTLQRHIRERLTLDMLRLICPIGGCTMAFNYKAKQASIPYNNTRYQDSVVCMAVAAQGGVVDMLLEPTMLYRLHSTNTCGINETGLWEKCRRFGQFLSGQHRMYLLYKLYGGGGFLKFIGLRIKLYQRRGF